MSSVVARGIDHIGIAVEDLDAASQFLVEALDGEVMYDLFSPTADGGVVVNDADGPTEEPLDLGDVEIVDAPDGLGFVGHRMVRLGSGATIELLQISYQGARTASYGDFGTNHFGVFVDDMDAAASRIEAAGGKLYDRFEMFGLEAGERAQAQYALGPAGIRLELISYGTLAYEDSISQRRLYAGARETPSEA